MPDDQDQDVGNEHDGSTPEDANDEIECDGEVTPDIAHVFGELPGFEDDVYLRMQATNLHMVDGYIRQLESDLLRSYFELERTPVPETMFVSALSQLWIFGLYELLRTWRQRAREVLAFAAQMEGQPDADRQKALNDLKTRFVRTTIYPEGSASFAFAVYERVAEDAAYADRLRKAVDASELLFRRIEALRMMLAKRELPGQKGVSAMAPGYGRIDLSNGSLYWQVELSDHEVDVMSRQAVAQGLATLAESVDHRVISVALQAKLRGFPKFAYGLKKVTAVRSDGEEFPGTLIAWNKIVVDVLGSDDMPFSADDIVDLRAEDGSIEDLEPPEPGAF